MEYLLIYLYSASPFLFGIDSVMKKGKPTSGIGRRNAIPIPAIDSRETNALYDAVTILSLE